MVINLVSNAVKFCDKSNGLVRFRASHEDRCVRVDVVDNGIGIAPENLDRIFERFQQAGNTLTDKPHGTGLGLPISRQILDRFGGELSVTSELGKGAMFSFRLPLAPVDGTSDVVAPRLDNRVTTGVPTT